MSVHITERLKMIRELAVETRDLALADDNDRICKMVDELILSINSTMFASEEG